MSDEEETGFGDEDIGGFGEDFDDADGFGEEFDDDADGFGEDAEEEAFDEDGTGWGNVDEDEEVDGVTVAPAGPAGFSEQFVDFGKKYFNLENTFEYQIEPLKKSLLKLDAAKERIAIEQFVHVCQFMGITAKVGKGTMSAIGAVQKITSFGIREEHLREELFVQILKQMHKNPAAASRARGTILLTLVIGTFSCSSKLLPIVDTFIREGPKGYVSYCSLLLRRTIHNGPRSQPPCSLEFEAVKRKQVMKVNVTVDLVTGEKVTARLDAATVMSEWVQEIASNLQITDTYGWSIFVDRFGVLESLRGAGGKGLHAMDVISKIDMKAKALGISEFLEITGQLSFRKELFAADHDSMKDPRATHLAFNQIRQGIKEGLYVCDDNEYDEILAMIFYADFKDEIEESKVTGFLDYWLPPDAKKRKSPKDRAAAVERHHAKSEYSRKKFDKTMTHDKVLRFALDKWGKVNSFSSDGSIMLYPNGKSQLKKKVSLKRAASKKK